MPRNIIKIDQGKDEIKSHYELFRELYNHTDIKGYVGKNMLATVYVNDPNNFKEKDMQVQLILKNQIQWP